MLNFSYTRKALAASVLVSQALAFCEYGTTLRPRSEDSVPVGTFAYAGIKGPTNWLALNPTANALCATGKHQSPIDMIPGDFSEVSGADLAFNIPDINSTAFENLGVTVEVVASGTMTVPDKGVFTLKQFHFHLPSEHLDNGTSSAMEMHTVWQNNASEVSVVGLYIDIAETRTTRIKCRSRKCKFTKRAGNATEASGVTGVVTDVLNTVGEIATPGTSTDIGPLKMSELVSILKAATFQTYSGSLTTPPCTEGVNWFVSNQKLSIPLSTFSKVRDVIGFNARFPQNTLGQENLLAASNRSLNSL